MTLNPEQRQVLENWMRSKAVMQCPACRVDSWRFAEALYIRALLEEGDTDLSETKGVVKLTCGNCAYVMLFDAEQLDIRGLWDRKRGL